MEIHWKWYKRQKRHTDKHNEWAREELKFTTRIVYNEQCHSVAQIHLSSLILSRLSLLHAFPFNATHSLSHTPLWCTSRAFCTSQNVCKQFDICIEFKNAFSLQCTLLPQMGWCVLTIHFFMCHRILCFNGMLFAIASLFSSFSPTKYSSYMENSD